MKREKSWTETPLFMRNAMYAATVPAAGPAAETAPTRPLSRETMTSAIPVLPRGTSQNVPGPAGPGEENATSSSAASPSTKAYSWARAIACGIAA